MAVLPVAFTIVADQHVMERCWNALSPSEVFNVSRASPAMLNHLRDNIVAARRQREDRLEGGNGYILVHNQRMRFWMFQVWAESVFQTVREDETGPEDGLQGMGYELLYSQPVMVYRYDDECDDMPAAIDVGPDDPASYEDYDIAMMMRWEDQFYPDATAVLSVSI